MDNETKKYEVKVLIEYWMDVEASSEAEAVTNAYHAHDGLTTLVTQFSAEAYEAE